MTLVLALLIGVAIGSVPSADWLARRRGIDLRATGSTNPGTNNAFRSGGRSLGASVLAVELVKGFVAVWIGAWLASVGGAALAGAGATLGNVYNPWFGLQGGKGLAITAGTLLAAWPTAAAALIAVIAAAIAAWRRSGPASLLTLAVYLGLVLLGLTGDLPGRWAVETSGWAGVMALGQVVTMFPKHLQDSIRPIGRLGSRG